MTDSLQDVVADMHADVLMFSDHAVRDAIREWADRLSALAAPVEWMPIESAPETKSGIWFGLLVWGPEEDKSTGHGFRLGNKWYAGGIFHQIGQDRKYHIRETEVNPTHWMEMPLSPGRSGEVDRG